MKNLLKNKKIIISLIVLMTIIGGIISGLVISGIQSDSKKTANNSRRNLNTIKENVSDLSSKQKEVFDVEETSEDKAETEAEKNYSETYKDYLELPDEKKENTEVIPRKDTIEINTLDDLDGKIDPDNKESTIPSSYNLKDKLNIKVENQGQHGLCWDFASIKSLETFLALNEGKDYDLSEMHVNYITSNLMYGYRQINDGGNFSIFKNYLSVSDVVSEKDVPYHDYQESEYDKFNDITPVKTVTETIDFPTIIKHSKNEENEFFLDTYTEEDLAKQRELVKKHIMTNGSVYAEIDGNNIEYLPSHTTLYSSPSTTGYINHAISIVGWDDNYSKENFTDRGNGQKPEHDGAYIALNSWGENWGDNGYFYISYEDKYVESGMSGIISTSFDNNTYKLSSLKDGAIKDYLTEKLGYSFKTYNGEEYLTKNALSNIYSIDLSNRKNVTLDNIELFPKVYYVDLSNTDVSDISELSKLSDISYINLENTNVKNVSALKDLPHLSSLDISDNKNISGYNSIKTLGYLDISNCGITNLEDLSSNENLSNIVMNDNPLIFNQDKLPSQVYTLNVSNCNITNLSELNRHTDIIDLNVSNNNLTSLNGIDELHKLVGLDISGNTIDDFSPLKNLNFEHANNNSQNESQEEVPYEYYYSLKANNCNIEDISIFNEMKFNSLDLKNNKIQDLSKFENNNVTSLNLSENKNLTGFDSLKNLYELTLENCEISDLTDIVKLDKLTLLDLKNNKITDMTPINNLKNLETLSLSENRNLSGTLDLEKLNYLNISNCNLATFDFSKLKNCYGLNISDNYNLKNLYDLVKDSSINYVEAQNYTMPENEFEKIYSDTDNYMLIANAVIDINCDYNKDSKTIDLINKTPIKKILRNSIVSNNLSLVGGKLNRNGYLISVFPDLNGIVSISPISTQGLSCCTLNLNYLSSINQNVETTNNENKNNNNIDNKNINANSINNTNTENSTNVTNTTNTINNNTNNYNTSPSYNTVNNL